MCDLPATSRGVSDPPDAPAGSNAESTHETSLFTSVPITVVQTTTIVRALLYGEIDIRDAVTVRAAADTTVRAALQARRCIIVDCTAVTFMDSSALAFFALLIRSRRPVTVTGLQAPLRQMLRVSGIDQLLTMTP